LPAELFPGLGDGKPLGDQIGVLAREHGFLLGSAQERVSTALPSTPIASILGAASGSPVVVMDRVVLMLDDRRAVEWRVAHCHLPGSYYLADIR
jgi:DNA-binding GntR family transcriptional regulator